MIKNENDLYIERIKELLKDVKNPELVTLTNRLISEREYLAETIMIDPKTGVYNPRIISEKIIRNVGAAVMIDIDYFKTVNDTFGHDVGDDVLQKVAHILLSNVRTNNDVVCRYGGDEFLVIFTTPNKDVVKTRVEKMCEDVRTLLQLPNYTVTLSIGVSFSDGDNNLGALIKKADEALYYSKENGRNQVNYYGEHQLLLK